VLLYITGDCTLLQLVTTASEPQRTHWTYPGSWHKSRDHSIGPHGASNSNRHHVSCRTRFCVRTRSVRGQITHGAPPRPLSRAWPKWHNRGKYMGQTLVECRGAARGGADNRKGIGACAAQRQWFRQPVARATPPDRQQYQCLQTLAASCTEKGAKQTKIPCWQGGND
jgi:hypothetical protein